MLVSERIKGSKPTRPIFFNFDLVRGLNMRNNHQL